MPVVSKIQNGFTAGELDPKLRARTDIGQYYNGAAKMRNVLVIPQGAAVRRPGLEYVGKLPSGNIKFIPFVFSETDHYLCVLTTNLLTIYKGGEVMDTVVCTVSDTQVSEVTWAQSYDTLLIFHEDFVITSFLRASETSWSTAAWPVINTPTYANRSVQSTTLTIVDSADAELDWSAWTTGNTNAGVKFGSSGTPFVAGDVGSYIRGSAGGYAKITAYTDTANVVGTVVAPFTNTIDGETTNTVLTATDWNVEDPSWSSTNGYPRCGTFFQGRLWVAGTTAQPNTIWASKTNQETDFQSWIPSYDDSGMEITAGGGVMSNFKQLHSGQHLVAMADNGQYYIPISKSEPVTPTNASLIRNSSYGVEGTTPIVEVDGNLLFLKQGGQSLVESSYNFANGSYVNTDLSLLSSHLLDSPIAMAYRKQTSTNESDYILVVNSDGTLAVLCTLRVQNVTAWTLCETEGDFIATGVDDSVMYFAVDRVIGGVSVRCLEKFNFDALLDSAVVDQYDTLTTDGTTMTYDGVPLVYRTGEPYQLTTDTEDMTYDGTDLTYGEQGVTTFTHLGHLNNQEVQIVIDNTVQTAQPVVDGSLTLAKTANRVQAGLQFPIVDEDSDSIVYVETMPIEAEDASGSSVGRKKRVVEATVMLYDTSSCEIKKNKVTIRKIGVDPLDAPVPKRSTNITVSGLLGWDDEIEISVGQTLALPFQLLGLAYKVRI